MIVLLYNNRYKYYIIHYIYTNILYNNFFNIIIKFILIGIVQFMFLDTEIDIEF